MKNVQVSNGYPCTKVRKIFLHILLFQNIVSIFFVFEKKISAAGGGVLADAIAKNASSFFTCFLREHTVPGRLLLYLFDLYSKFRRRDDIFRLPWHLVKITILNMIYIISGLDNTYGHKGCWKKNTSHCSTDFWMNCFKTLYKIISVDWTVSKLFNVVNPAPYYCPVYCLEYPELNHDQDHLQIIKSKLYKNDEL